MKLDRVNKPRGHYSGIWLWLDEFVGEEGKDYTIKDEPASPAHDSWVVSEIVFTDPKHETLAQLRWS